MSTIVSIRTLPASEGIGWIKRAFELIKMNPIMVPSSFFLYLLTLLLVQQVPVIGVLLPGLLVPTLFFGIMAVLRMVAQRERPSLGVFFSGFSDPTCRSKLLISGVIYSIGFMCAIAASSLADGGLMFRAIVLGQAIDPTPVQVPRQTLAQLVALIALTPTAACFWIAPQLIVWHGMSVSKALFFSFFAFWRNILPITTFFVSIGAMLMAFALILSALAHLLGAPNAAVNTMVPISLFIFVVVYAAFYASYESLVEVKEV